jgi:hypothetical protein
LKPTLFLSRFLVIRLIFLSLPIFSSLHMSLPCSHSFSCMTVHGDTTICLKWTGNILSSRPLLILKNVFSLFLISLVHSSSSSSSFFVTFFFFLLFST